MSEPREFWIDETNNYEVWEFKPDHFDQCVHLIEKSAYDTLKAELKQANIKIEELTKRDFQEMMKTGLYEAESENEQLRAALLAIADNIDYSYEASISNSEIARKALETKS